MSYTRGTDSAKRWKKPLLHFRQLVISPFYCVYSRFCSPHL